MGSRAILTLLLVLITTGTSLGDTYYAANRAVKATASDGNPGERTASSHGRLWDMRRINYRPEIRFF